MGVSETGEPIRNLQDLMRRLIAAGGLRPRSTELLMTEFMGPLLLWRHRQALLARALCFVGPRESRVGPGALVVGYYDDKPAHSVVREVGG